MNVSMITVRFWAGARAAAGVGEITVPAGSAGTVAELVRAVLEVVEPDRRDHLARVVAACSVLVDGQGIAGRDPAQVLLAGGQVVELLPPFAGG